MASYTELTTIEGETLYMDTELINTITNLIGAGRPVAIFGEPGSGKSDLARTVMAQSVERGIISNWRQMEYGGITSGDLLDGERTLDDDGKLTMIPSQWLLTAREAASGTPVGIVHDELNRASPSGLNKYLRVYSHFEYVSDIDGILKWNPREFHAIATLNVGFGFTGTSRMDAALADRFYPVRIEAPPKEIIEQILQKRYPNMSEADRNSIIKAYQISRSSTDDYKIGVRDVVRIADGMTLCNHTLEYAVETFVGGSVLLNNLPETSTSALLSAVKAVSKKKAI